MDTRSKINPELTPLSRLVLGYFDPVHAAHVQRLRELCPNGQRIAIAVVDPPAPILPLRARAELLASLAMVDRVYETPDLDQLAPAEVIDERSADLQRTDNLIRNVVSRNRK